MRLSLFGGGTDVNPFAQEYGGQVVNLAIDKRVYIIKKNNNRISSFSDIDGSGLGSSASYFVSWIALMTGLKNKHEIADKAFRLETELFGWHGGRQDQYAAALGGFNHMIFTDKTEILPLPKPIIKEFSEWMVLINTGINRKSFDIQRGFVKPKNSQIKALKEMVKQVNTALDLFGKRDYESIGKLMHETWELKKRSNKVSNRELDNIYTLGLRLGAFGGKVMGAGQGGHFLFIVRPEDRVWFEAVISQYFEVVNFQPEFKGLEIIK